MAESIPDLRREPKDRAYAQLHAYFLQVMAGIDDDVAGMATLSAFLHHAFGHLWTGFYRVVSPNLLRVGPYQGSLGCLDIAFGRGVCGTAAVERRSLVVPDVDRFPGHITCDARSKSELVVPVFDAGGRLIAVLDIDSDRRGAFDAQDVVGLERIVRWFAGVGRG
jgi:L-methionine (R)-S-oxide reductase